MRRSSLLLLAMTMAIVAAAQSAFFSFTGPVADESSRGVPGTTLVLQRTAPNEIRGEDERWRPVRVRGIAGRGLWPRGDRASGFQEVKDVITISGQNLQRNVALKLGTLQETITVSFDPAERAGEPMRAPPSH